MDENTIQVYNAHALDYDEQTKDFWEHFPNDFLDKFADNAQNPILDVGSGPGRDGLLLKNRGLEVVCLDASKEMVKLSLSKGLPSVIGDFLKLPFPDGSFNGVWAYTSLIHVNKADFAKALAEIYRVLAPGAPLGLGMIEGNGESYEYKFKDVNSEHPRLFTYYSLQELTSILELSGFNTFYTGNTNTGRRNFLHIICKKI